MTQEIRLLRSFVRGETQVEALTALGARINFDAEGLRMDEPADAPVYKPSPGDVARGLLAHSQVGANLQDWARVLLATRMIDLSCLEDHPDGELLLEAVWDAAEAPNIDEKRLEVARRLAATA